ncbi:MAG: restriction endonuclease subunit S [Saprospiraceae bacterium]|nr:restriction endonuclease subunit S [Saprospiraceae bacterium]
MKSNYKKIGEHIREVNVRNSSLKANTLLGINIDKYYMPSVANTVGTDLSVYKIVEKNQFACNRMHVGRDYRLPIALSKNENEFIVSPAYDVFEIIDTEKLLPEYLMLWFSRTEFDRNAWFFTDADVRGGLPWKSFCEMDLPIPSPDKQKEIIKEYNTIVDRITLNNQFIQKLEETAHAIYQHWFIDFEFPDKDYKPYKSSGGEMELNKELESEIPKGWRYEQLGNLIEYKKGFAFKSDDYQTTGVPIIRVSDFTAKSIDISNCNYLDEAKAKELKKYSLNTNDIIITTVGSWPDNPASIVGKVISVPEIANNGLLNQNAVRLRTLDSNGQIFIYYRLRSNEFTDYVVSGAQGSANQASVTLEHVFKFRTVMPDKRSSDQLFKPLNLINNKVAKLNTENHYLSLLRDLLLSKLATIEY